MDTDSKALRIVAFLGVVVFLGGIGLWVLFSNFSGTEEESSLSSPTVSAPSFPDGGADGNAGIIPGPSEGEEAGEETPNDSIPAPTLTPESLPEYEYYDRRDELNRSIVYPLERFLSRDWRETPNDIQEQLADAVRPKLLLDMMSIVNDFDWEACREEKCVIDAENIVLEPTEQDNVYFAGFMLVKFTEADPEGQYVERYEYFVEFAPKVDGGWVLVSLTDASQEGD